MSNQPYLPLYTGDWKKDPKLSLCSVATRGVWIDLLCSLHDGRIGQVTGTPEQIARLCRCNAAECHAALLELQTSGAANVSERDGLFTVICRRMKKALEISQMRSDAAAKAKQNASKPLAKPKHPCEDEIEDESLFKKRFGNLFRRRDNTAWNDRELTAFARLNGHVTEEDMAAVERYYREDIPKDKDYRRRDLLTLLNNWNGEVDRARARLPKIRATVAQRPVEIPVVDPIKEADFQKRLKEWREAGRPLEGFPT